MANSRLLKEPPTVLLEQTSSIMFSRKSPKEEVTNKLQMTSSANVLQKSALSPANKLRLFNMGGFAENKLEFDEDGLLSDDGASYDLDELSAQMESLTDEEVLE